MQSAALEHRGNRGCQRVVEALIQGRCRSTETPRSGWNDISFPPTNQTPTPLRTKMVYAREDMLLNRALTYKHSTPALLLQVYNSYWLNIPVHYSSRSVWVVTAALSFWFDRNIEKQCFIKMTLNAWTVCSPTSLIFSPPKLTHRNADTLLTNCFNFLCVFNAFVWKRPLNPHTNMDG